MAPTAPVTTVNDFTVLSLHIAGTPPFPKKTTHCLYLRANVPKVPTENTHRQAFLVNVPIDATETHVRTLFADHLGGARVEKVAFEGAPARKGIQTPIALAPGTKRKRGDESSDGGGGESGKLPETWDRELHRSGSTAVVTLADKPSADLAMKSARRAAREARQINWDECALGSLSRLGSARYLLHHQLRHPDHAALQLSVDDFMTAFSAHEAEVAARLKRQRSEPDEDGFITVTRGGRSGPAREEETKAKEEELKRREKNRVKEDFYRFQVRERKKAVTKGLVKGFEDDARKVEEMRKRRGKLRPE